MSLNCRPGDLARVISTPETREVGIVDWFFVVVLPDGRTDAEGRVAWSYKGPPRRIPQGIFKGLKFRAVGDHILRPIRDPGPDAVDETLTCDAWLRHKYGETV